MERRDTPPDDADSAHGADLSPFADLSLVRHDLRNHLTALLSGCDLVERCVESGQLARLDGILAEMRRELQSGFDAIDRLRVPDPDGDATARDAAGADG